MQRMVSMNTPRTPFGITALDKMISGGLVTLEKVKVLHYRGQVKS